MNGRQDSMMSDREGAEALCGHPGAARLFQKGYATHQVIRNFRKALTIIKKKNKNDSLFCFLHMKKSKGLAFQIHHREEREIRKTLN